MRSFRVWVLLAVGAIMAAGLSQCARTVNGPPPPVQSDITVTDEGDGTQRVEWTTSDPTLGVIEYGLDSARYYLFAYRAGDRFRTDHQIRLFNLSASEKYFFRVRSVSGNGQAVFSANLSFTEGAVTYHPKLLRMHLVDITNPCQSNYNPGDNFFIEFPNGKTMMIDSGDDQGSPTITSYIHGLGHDTIDYGVLTHAHSDHYNGYLYGGIATSFTFLHFLQPNTQLDLYNRFDGVYAAMTSHNPSCDRFKLKRGDSRANDAMLAGIDPDVDVVVMSAGADTLPIDNGNSGDPTSSSKVNNSSLAMKFTFGSMAFMMTGDLEQEAWRNFIQNNPVANPAVDILKVAHHSRDDGVNDGIITVTDPIIAIASTQNCNCNGLMQCAAADIVVAHHADFFRADMADPNLNRSNLRGDPFQSNIVVTTDGTTIIVSHRRL